MQRTFIQAVTGARIAIPLCFSSHSASSAAVVQFNYAAKDAFRSVDYLESRLDIDKAAIGFYGMSFGCNLGTLILALDSRFRAGVLLCGGLWNGKSSRLSLASLPFANQLPRTTTRTVVLTRYVPNSTA